MKVAHLAATIVLMLPRVALAQAIQRCEDYSTEDVDEADARTKELVTEYRRVCG
jgi:hypothetical protein